MMRIGVTMGLKYIAQLCNLQYSPNFCSYLRSSAAKEACDYLTKVLGTNPLLLQELDLSRIELRDMNWENISALLVDSHCTVGKIK